MEKSCLNIMQVQYIQLHVSKDLLLFNDGSTLIALNKKGDEVWSAELDSDYIRIKEDENGGIYAAVGGYSTPPKLVSLSRKDGSINWEFTFLAISSKSKS